jgi:L,D-transpeptidase catalytic domain
MRRFDTSIQHFHPSFPSVAAAALFTAFAFSISDAAAQVPSNNQPAAKPESTRRIVVSIPDRKLALLQDGRVVKTYNVAVGASPSPSPSGEFQIVRRLTNPGYYKPGVVVSPGSGNPLGTRWLGLNVKGFGIHGTNRPGSIGKNASHGCIRLKNSDMEDLFARVREGDHVSLLAERTAEVAQLFGHAASPTAIASNQTQIARNESAGAEDNSRATE